MNELINWTTQTHFVNQYGGGYSKRMELSLV